MDEKNPKPAEIRRAFWWTVALDTTAYSCFYKSEKVRGGVMCIMMPDNDCEEGKWERQFTEALQRKGN